MRKNKGNNNNRVIRFFEEPVSEIKLTHTTKFWKIQLKDNTIIIGYGKIGTNPKFTEKCFLDEDSAIEFYVKQITTKKNKGYIEEEVLLRQDAVEDDITTDDEEDKIELTSLPELHHKENDLSDFFYDNTYCAVLVYIPDCEPCEEFKPKFCDMSYDKVKFGVLNIEEFEKNFGEIENNGIDVFPTVQLCKRGRIYKTVEAPTINAIKKQLNCMIKCIGLKALSDECKDRGMSPMGKKEELETRIKEDDEIGWELHNKSCEELVDYIIENKIKKPTKVDKKTNIQLIKYIRKYTEIKNK